MTNPPQIAALLRERDGYRQRGLTDRVAEVARSLTAAGYVEAEPVPVPIAERIQPETASIEAPETAKIPTGRPRRSEADVQDR